jgi:type I restriction enzyme S subunit
MQNGIYKAAQFYNDSGIACLRMYNIENGEIVWKEIKRMILTEAEVDQYQLKPGDILINRVNSRELVGKAAVIPLNIETCVYESKNIRLRLFQESTQSEFVNYWFRIHSQKYFNQNAQQTVGMASINQEQIGSMPIPFPPLNEQKRIVAKIEELRDRLHRSKQALEAVPELCDRFRQSILAAAFRGDLTADWREENPDVEPASVLLERIRSDRRQRWEKTEIEKMKSQGKVPESEQWKQRYKETTGRGSRKLVAEIKAQKYRIEDLPDGWTAVRLGEVTQVQTGYAFKSQWFTPNGIRLLRGTNIIPGSTRWDDVAYLSEDQAAEFQEYFLAEDDIVIAMDRPVISTGLKIARLNSNDLPALLLQRVGRFKLESGIDSDFLYGFLNSQLFLGHIQDQATGTQLPHISANDIESAIIPLPPLKEQKQIAELINKWMHKVAHFNHLVESSKLEFEIIQQSILAKAFRGELVEQDPNDEPASVLLDRIRAERQAQESKKSTGVKGKRKKASSKQLDLPGVE